MSPDPLSLLRHLPVPVFSAATKCPRLDWCASPGCLPPLPSAGALPAGPESHLSPSRMAVFLVQGHPFSWVHSTLPTILPTASLYSMV